MIKNFILLLLLTATTLADASPNPNSGLRSSRYEDLKDHPSSSNTYSEVWTYHFILDNGAQIVLNYNRANMGSFKDPVAGADASFINFKGKNYAVAREYPKKNFVWNDAEHKLNVHKNVWFEGKLPEAHRVHFFTTKKKITYTIDLAFSDITPGKVWGDGIFEVAGEKVGLFLHIPRARVKGKIGINQDIVEVEGVAYMTHTFQTKMATKLIAAGCKYYSTGENINMGYFVRPLGKHKVDWIGYGLYQNGQDIELITSDLTIHETEKIKGVSLPTTFALIHNDREIRVTRNKDLQSHSILGGIDNKLKRWAAKQFIGGEPIYVRSLGAVNDTPAVTDFFGVR